MEDAAHQASRLPMLWRMPPIKLPDCLCCGGCHPSSFQIAYAVEDAAHQASRSPMLWRMLPIKLPDRLCCGGCHPSSFQITYAATVALPILSIYMTSIVSHPDPSHRKGCLQLGHQGGGGGPVLQGDNGTKPPVSQPQVNPTPGECNQRHQS